jgi:lipopolysaccharide transport system permease protein
VFLPSEGVRRHA